MPIVDYATLCLEGPEPDSDASPIIRTLQRATPHLFQSTTATSTTIVADAVLTGSAATNYVGCLVRAQNGAAQGQVRRVSAYNGSSTLTVEEAFSPAPDNTTTWEMWYPPEAIVVESNGAAGANTIRPVAATDVSGRPGRNEATGFWTTPSRWMLLGIGGVNDDRMALITAWDGTDFTVETGVFSQAAIGDLFVIRKLMNQRGDHQLAELPHAAMTRRSLKTVLDGDPLVMGSKGGSTFGAALEVAPVQAAATGATAAVPPAEAHDLLNALFTYSAGATSTVVADGTGVANSTTHVRIGNGERTRFQVGQLALISGQVRCIVDSATGDGTHDSLFVSPALSVIPVAGVVVYGAATYEHGAQLPNEFRTTCIEQFVGTGGTGSIRETIYGWLPDLTLAGMDADGAKLQWEFKGPASFHWTDPKGLQAWSTAYGGRPPAATYGLPFLARDGVVSLSATPATAAAGSTGSAVFTQITCRSLKVMFGFNPVRWQPGITGPAGDEGIVMAGLADSGCRIALSLDLDDNVLRQRFEAGTELELLAQFGAAPGGAFGLHARSTQIVSYGRKRGDGRVSADLTCQVNRTNITANDTDGAGTIVLPMFRFGAM